MANNLDELIVVDVESTCWDKQDGVRLQESEIIEIGVSVIDLSELKRVACEGILVKPENSTVSEFCTSLTTITQEMLDFAGISFERACEKLVKEHRTKNRAWASWGDYDRKQFTRQCERTGIKYPFGPTHINVKNMFAITCGLSREVGMEEALNLLNIPLEGTHHRGIDDARNIAKIACELLQTGRKHFRPKVLDNKA